MVMRCVVTETAARLCLELEAYSIPDDFEPTGKYRQVVARIRDEYTNYRRLRAALPACPLQDCGGRTGTGMGCASYDLAHDLLEIEARRLAMGVYGAWQARRERAHAGDKSGELVIAVAE